MAKKTVKEIVDSLVGNLVTTNDVVLLLVNKVDTLEKKVKRLQTKSNQK